MKGQRAIRIDVAQLLTEADVKKGITNHVGFDNVQSTWAVNDGEHALRISVTMIDRNDKPRFLGTVVVTLDDLMHTRPLRNMPRSDDGLDLPYRQDSER